MDNKVNNKLNFSNVKQTQLESGQVLKGSFSELQSALRTYATNPILTDAYTHFSQTVNVDGYPTFVEYWQASSNSEFKLNFVQDISGSLAGTYIVIEEYLSKKTIAFYYVVDGIGDAPEVADEEYPVAISQNDPAAIVRSAFQTAASVLDTISINNTSSFLATSVNITMLQFGQSTPIDVSNSLFSLDIIRTGDSFKVGEISLKYDASNNPIYNGSTLRGLLFNPYTASFDVERDEISVTATVDLGPLISKDPTVYNVAMALANTEYSITIPVDTKRFQINIRDHLSPYTVSYVSGGSYLSKAYGVVYEEQGLELTASTNTLYFTAKKDNMVMEIITWK